MKLFKCCCSVKKRTKKDVVILLVGLDNAGKTTILRSLTGRDLRVKVLPTVGFSSAHMKHRGCNSVTFYDLGGGDSIRDIWPSYFKDVHGVMFAVDSCDRERLPIAKASLHSLISAKYIRTKPILVIGTKQDQTGVMDDGELAEGLDLEELVNRMKTPARLELTSTVRSVIDPGLQEGYRWLVGQVLKRWEELNARVIRDRERANQMPIISSITTLPAIEQVSNGKHIALVHSADSGVAASPVHSLRPENPRDRRTKSAGDKRWKNKIHPAGAVDRVGPFRLLSASSLCVISRHPTQSRELLFRSSDALEGC